MKLQGRILSIVLCIILFCALGKAQTTEQMLQDINRCRKEYKKDSARYFLDKAWKSFDLSPDTTRYKLWVAKAMVEQDFEQNKAAFTAYSTALQMAISLKDSARKAESLNNLGIAYYRTQQYDSALQYFMRSGELKILLKDSVGAGRAYNNTGIMHDILGQPGKAVENYYRALRIYENIGDESLIFGTITNIGLVQINQQNYKDALLNYRKALHLAKKTDNKTGIVTALNSLGIIHDKELRYDSAYLCYTEALQTGEEIDYKYGVAQSLNNLGINAQYRNNHREAIDFYHRAIVIKEELGNKSSLAISHIGLGEVYDLSGRYAEALKHLNTGLLLAEETGYAEYVKKAHEQLHKTYASTKNSPLAYHHLLLFSEIKDSLMNAENMKTIAQLNTQYETEKKEQAIALLHQENALTAAELKSASAENARKTWMLIAAGGSGFLMLCLIVIVIRNNRRQRDTNLILANQNTQISEQKSKLDHAYHELSDKNREILDSINYAKRIQTAILTPVEEIRKYLPGCFVLYRPKDIVAGDFYWFEKVENRMIIAAADCTGHGVPGAMVSVVCHNALNKAVFEEKLRQPAAILDKVREIVIATFAKSGEEVKDGMDISLLAIVQTPAGTIELEWSGANNPLWLVKQDDAGKLEEFKADKQPIGLYAGGKPFTNHVIQATSGDSIYLFSDGYADQFGGQKGKKFKYSQLKELLLKISGLSSDEQNQILHDEFENWRGTHEQLDDVCVIGIKL